MKKNSTVATNKNKIFKKGGAFDLILWSQVNSAD